MIKSSLLYENNTVLKVEDTSTVPRHGIVSCPGWPNLLRNVQERVLRFPVVFPGLSGIPSDTRYGGTIIYLFIYFWHKSKITSIAKVKENM